MDQSNMDTDTLFWTGVFLADVLWFLNLYSGFSIPVEAATSRGGLL